MLVVADGSPLIVLINIGHISRRSRDRVRVWTRADHRVRLAARLCRLSWVIVLGNLDRAGIQFSDDWGEMRRLRHRSGTEADGV